MNQLHSNNKRASFQVPQDYFDNFAEGILEHIASGEVAKKKNKLFTSIWAYAVAATFVGLLFLSHFLINSNTSGSKIVDTYDSYVLSQVDESVMLEYFFVSNED